MGSTQGSPPRCAPSGWHRPDTTPCGRPVPIAEAHALLELSRTDRLTQQELAASLNLQKSTVSRIVVEHIPAAQREDVIRALRTLTEAIHEHDTLRTIGSGSLHFIGPRCCWLRSLR